jgi:hypothetical protein
MDFAVVSCSSQRLAPAVMRAIAMAQAMSRFLRTGVASGAGAAQFLAEDVAMAGLAAPAEEAPLVPPRADVNVLPSEAGEPVDADELWVEDKLDVVAMPDCSADPGVAVVDGIDMMLGNSIGGGLRPPGESSVAPKGIPVRATGWGRPLAAGEESDPADRIVVVCIGAQGSEAPMLPPAASNCAVDWPPVIVQGVLVDGGGLTPGVAISVAPIGIPTGDTGEPGPIPSGEVIPSGDAGEAT